MAGAEEVLFEGPGYVICRTDELGPPVPYPPAERENGDLNHGFLDLRDRPDLVVEVPEAQKCSGMAELLRAINAPGSALMSVGCECAVFPQVQRDHSDPRFLAGGYVDLTFRDPGRNSDPANLVRLAQQILSGVKVPEEGWVCFKMTVQPLRHYFGLPGRFGLELAPRGLGVTEPEAWRSLELATSGLADAIRKIG